MVLAIDMMDGYGLSSKVCHARLLKDECSAVLLRLVRMPHSKLYKVSGYMHGEGFERRVNCSFKIRDSRYNVCLLGQAV